MDIVTLKKQIQQGKLDRFYVFAGEEIALQNIYLDKMGELKRADTVTEIWGKLTNSKCLKLFKQDHDYIYVVRDDDEFIKNNKLSELIGLINNNTLVLCVTKIDKKTKFYKAVKDYVIEFNKMTTQQLLPTVMNASPIKDRALISQFIEACDNDYGAIMSEIDKVKYGGTEVLEEVIRENISFSSFALVDKIFKRDRDAITYAIKLLEQEENELGVLTLIFNKASQLLQLKEGINPEGLNEWAGKKMKENNRLDQRALYRATRWCKLYIEGIKNGDYQAYDAMLLCIMKILQ